MTQVNFSHQNATGSTTAKETKGKWIYIYQYEDSDGGIEQIIDEYPTKEEAYEAMKYTYERCQWMNRCLGYENPMAYITDDSALTNESSGNTIKLWIKKNNRKRSWLKNAKKLDDIERETGEKLAKEFGFESVSELNKFIEMIGQNKTK